MALELFSKVQQPLTIAFLQTYPTLEAARSASVEDLARLLRRYHHRSARVTAQKIWSCVQAPQLQADAVTIRTKTRLLLALLSQLAPLHEQLRAYDEEITRLFVSHPDSPLFGSLPRAGQRLAPRLLVGWGDDRTRFASAASVQALAGTSPVAYASGKFARAYRRHACVKPPRNALYQFAWQSTVAEPWATAYYRRKRSEGKTHSMALRALANCWVRIIHAMWLTQTPYRAEVFLTAQRVHASSAA